MKTRILSVVAVCILCCICLIALPQEAQAAECDGFTYEIRDGKATITGCTLEYNYFMDIPQTIDGYPVVSIGAQAFEDCTDLLQVTIPEGVETIEAYAFYQCYNLTWLYLPDSLISIETNAFTSCWNLEVVEFGDGLKTIGDGAFSFCKKLHFFLDLPNNLESIGIGAFYDCDSLETVVLPNSLKELGSKAFAMCSRLTYVMFPDGLEKIGSQVLYMSACYYYGWFWDGDVFYMDAYLLDTKKTLSGSYTVINGTTNIADGAFFNCKDLTDITLPDSLRIVGDGAFENCVALEEITIPSGVTDIGDEAFYWCRNLAQIHVPDSVKHLGKDAFCGTAYYKDADNWENGALYAGSCLVECQSSVSGTLRVREGTTSIIGGAFKGLTNLTELILPDSLKTIGDEAVAGCTALKKVSIPDSVTTIGEKAFYGCSAVTEVSLGKNVSQIKAGAFGQCTNLESFSVHNENATYFAQNNCLIRISDKCLVVGCKSSQLPQDGSVTSIGPSAFEGCAGLTEVVIPDTITTIGESAFRDCNALISVKLGNGVQVVGARAFSECDVLSQIDLGQSVHTIEDYGFGYNNRITHVDFPASLRYLGAEAFSNTLDLVSVTFQEGLLSIGEGCFCFCENLTEVHLPDSLDAIPEAAFYACEALETVTFGDSLTYIGDSAFSGCFSLTSVALPANVHTVGNAAFHECTSLQWVDLANVQTIGYSAFESCSSLTEIYIPATVTSLGKQAFAYCPALTQMTVNPQNLYYRSAGNCIIKTGEGRLVSGCQSSVIPTDGSICTIDAYAFAGCSTLKSIVVPDSVTRIHEFAFYNCSGLEFMQLPFIGGESDCDNWLGYIFGGGPSQNDLCVPVTLKKVVITGGTKVGDNAFYKCRGLREIVLPESITHIGYDAFVQCPRLESIVLPANVETIKDANMLSGSPNAWLYLSKGCDSTVSFALENNLLHRVGGVITFNDGVGNCIDSTWYSYGAQIVMPEVPEKPADAYHTYVASWDPMPSTCTGNQTVRLRYVAATGEHVYNHECDADCNACGEIRQTSHVWDRGYRKEPTCKEEGYHRSNCKHCGELNHQVLEKLTTHTWDSGVVTKPASCKEAGVKTYTCDICGTTKTETVPMLTSHSYKTTTTKATLTSNGSIVKKCSVCGDVASTAMIARPANFALSTVNYTYNGAVKKPAVTVTDANGKALVNGTDYTVTYPSGRVNPGTYTVTVTMKGNYSGTKQLTFNIKLAVPTVSVSNAVNGVKITWNSITDATYYKVYKSVYTGGTWSSWTAIKTGVTGTAYTDTAVKSNDNVRYTVRAFNSSNSSSYKASSSIKFLAAPTVTATNAAKGVTVSWNKVSGAKSYIVYRSVYAGGKWSGWTRVAVGVTGTTYTDTAVKSGTTVKYTVRAVNGSFTSYFKTGNTTKFLAQPTAKVANTAAGIKVSWEKSSGTTGYIIYRRAYINGVWSGWTKINTTTGLSFHDTTAQKGVYYRYTVRAYSGSYRSSYQSSASIKR